MGNERLVEGVGELGAVAWVCVRCVGCRGGGGSAAIDVWRSIPSASEMEGSDCLCLVPSFSFSLVRRDSGGVWTPTEALGQVFVGGTP